MRNNRESWNFRAVSLRSRSKFSYFSLCSLISVGLKFIVRFSIVLLMLAWLLQPREPAPGISWCVWPSGVSHMWVQFTWVWGFLLHLPFIKMGYRILVTKMTNRQPLFSTYFVIELCWVLLCRRHAYLFQFTRTLLFSLPRIVTGLVRKLLQNMWQCCEQKTLSLETRRSHHPSRSNISAFGYQPVF